jgi:hypothetical protein
MEESTRATVIYGEAGGMPTKVRVTDDGTVVGQKFGDEETEPETPFKTRQELVSEWDEATTDRIIRELTLTVGEDGELIT